MPNVKRKLVQINILFKNAKELQTLKSRYEKVVKRGGLKDPNGNRRSFNRWCINHLLHASKIENDQATSKKSNTQF